MKDILLQQVEKIYKEIAEEDKKLNKDFISISLETIQHVDCEWVEE